MFEEDFTVFFDDGGFSKKICYTPSGYPHPSSKSIEVNVIIEDEYVPINGIETIATVATGAVSDFYSLSHGSNITDTTDNSNYVVRGVQQDGTGLVRLILEDA